MAISYLQVELDEYQQKVTSGQAELMVQQEAAQRERAARGKAPIDICAGDSGESFEVEREKINRLSSKAPLIATVLLVMLAGVSAFLLKDSLRLGFSLLFGTAAVILGGISWIRTKQASKHLEEVRIKDELRMRKEQERRWQEKTLADEITAREKRLATSVDNLEHIRGKLAQLEEMHSEKQIQLENRQADYEEYCNDSEADNAIAEEISGITMAMESIAEVSRNMHKGMEQNLYRRISGILSELTGGRYNQVSIDQDQQIILGSEEKHAPLWMLSKGTIEQVYFALRMAAAEILCQEEDMPVLFDDMFAMYDEERLAAALSWLAQNKKQVIIFTCSTREGAVARALDLNINQIEL